MECNGLHTWAFLAQAIVIVLCLRYTYFKLEKQKKDDGYEGQRRRERRPCRHCVEARFTVEARIVAV